MSEELIAKADELNLGAQKYKKLEKYAWIMILVAFGFFGLELWADIRLPYVIYTGMLVLGSIGIIFLLIVKSIQRDNFKDKKKVDEEIIAAVNLKNLKNLNK